MSTALPSLPRSGAPDSSDTARSTTASALAAVDVELRRRILPYLERVRDVLGVPILYVTHDPADVRQIADHAIVLEGGRVVKAGKP